MCLLDTIQSHFTINRFVYMKKYIIVSILTILVSCQLYSADTLGWRRLLPEITYEMVVDPTNPANIYAGGDGNLIYISRDHGKTWKKQIIIAQSGNNKMNNMVISRENPNIILVGGLGLGNLFRSDDYGKSWHEVTSSITNNCNLNGKALFEDPKIPGHFYMASYYDAMVFESKDKGLTWDTISYVYSPKIDPETGKFMPNTKHKQYPCCLGIRPDSTDILLCGNQGGLAMLSADKGKTWSHFNILRTDLSKKEIESYNTQVGVGDCEITMFAFDNVDPRKVYASITYTSYQNIPNGGIWRSLDGGYSWKQFAFPDSSFWGVATRTLENGEHEIFVGGYNADPNPADSSAIPGNKIVRGSFDGGKTWWVYDNSINWYDPTPVYHSVRVIGDNLLTIGTKGAIARSTNLAGTDFLSKEFNKNVDLFDGLIIGDTAMMFCGKNGRFYDNSRDQMEYDTTDTGYPDNINHLAQVDDFSYYAVGDNGLVLLSKNSIKRWDKQEVYTKNNLRSIAYKNSKIFICGDNGTILIRDLKNNTWSEKNICKEALYSISIADNGFGMVSGANGTVYKTIDNGENWTKIEVDYQDTLFGLKCRGDKQVIMVGKNSTMLYSKDAGITWTKQYPPITQNLFSVDFINDTIALAAGTSRTVFKVHLNKGYADIMDSQYGPLCNVWSLRYFGPKYKEKLYMATEGGLFVLDDLKSTVDEISKDDPNGNLNLKVIRNELFITYKRFYENSRNLLTMRIVDINGKTLISKSYTDAMFENIIDNIDIGILPNGAYIIEYIEKDKRSTKKFIKQ